MSLCDTFNVVDPEILEERENDADRKTLEGL